MSTRINLPLRDAPASWWKLASILVATAFGFFFTAPAEAAPGSQWINDLECNTGPVAENGAHEKNVAFIVGIDTYETPQVRPLNGAVNDAGKVYNLITGGKDPGFPKQNVCILTDKEATYANFKDSFRKALIEREGIEDADTVLFYFSGHGGQKTDFNGDESDQSDETLILQDTLSTITDGTVILKANGRPRRSWPQLVDDEFNKMLVEVYAKLKKKNLVVILDSCHSGTGARGADSLEKVEGAIARSTVLIDEDEGVTVTQKLAARGDGDGEVAEFTPAALGDSVFLSAAQDYQKAYERNGSGYFTDSLVKQLTNSRKKDLTYKQLIALVQADLAATGGTQQTPRSSGETGKAVFTNKIPHAPVYGWQVEGAGATNAIGKTFAISGLPTPGMGLGAELVILPGAYDAAAERTLDSAKARVVVFKQIAPNVAEVKVIKVFDKNKRIEPGDYAVVRKVSADARALRVKIRSAGEKGAVENAETFKRELRALFAARTAKVAAMPDDVDKDNRDFSQLVKFVSRGFDFELSQDEAGALVISDANGATRNNPRDISETARDLMNHLDQLTLMTTWKIDGGTMVANETVQVRLVRKDKSPQDSRCRSDYPVRDWTPDSAANTPQEIPLCAGYQIEVALAKDAPVAVNVAGTYLAANGERYHFPWDKTEVTLTPGDPPYVFRADDDHFQALPDGIGVTEYIFVLALPVEPARLDGGAEIYFKMPWHLLSSEDPPGDRGAGRGNMEKRNEYGTYSILPVTVKANLGFDDTSTKTSPVTPQVAQSREYTIDNFDITPYLPDNDKTALYRVLQTAVRLTKWGGDDGVKYKQHGWCEKSDDANLSKGIDCSRAIWYAFTRAKDGGVPYNRYASGAPDETMCVADSGKSYAPELDGYIYTGDMFREDSLMNDDFESCLLPDKKEFAKQLRLGDVLVYRDPVKGDGHTVMVIDPKDRIAWGSHGWDGMPAWEYENEADRPAQDIGVEFQKIKIKQDWSRWDRPTMKLVGCWRHRKFIEEARTPAGRPGMSAICNRVIRHDPRVYKGIYCERYMLPQ